MPPLSSAALRSLWFCLACSFFHRTSRVLSVVSIRGLCFNFFPDSSPFSETNLLWLICPPCWFPLHISQLISFENSLADSSKSVPFQCECHVLGDALSVCGEGRWAMLAAAGSWPLQTRNCSPLCHLACCPESYHLTAPWGGGNVPPLRHENHSRDIARSSPTSLQPLCDSAGIGNDFSDSKLPHFHCFKRGVISPSSSSEAEVPLQMQFM